SAWTAEDCRNRAGARRGTAAGAAVRGAGASVKALLDIVARHKRGERVGVYSLCSAHPQVVECALREARARAAPLLIEATSNQVNQFGGYTGMRPADFRRFVHDIAARVGFPVHLLWLG